MIPLSLFDVRGAKRGLGFHLCVIDIPPSRQRVAVSACRLFVGESSIKFWAFS